jgi:hypothetical protein
VLFLSIQQELDCISDNGRILGKIKFDHSSNGHIFCPTNESVVLSSIEKSSIKERLSGLDSGVYSILLQDDD